MSPPSVAAVRLPLSSALGMVHMFMVPKLASLALRLFLSSVVAQPVLDSDLDSVHPLPPHLALSLDAIPHLHSVALSRSSFASAPSRSSFKPHPVLTGGTTSAYFSTSAEDAVSSPAIAGRRCGGTECGGCPTCGGKAPHAETRTRPPAQGGRGEAAASRYGIPCCQGAARQET